MVCVLGQEPSPGLEGQAAGHDPANPSASVG